jgi:hypothetical protein
MAYCERERARARLAETPAPDNRDDLRKFEEEAATIIRQAGGHRSPSSTELLASAVDDVSRSYYQYLMIRPLHRGRRRPLGEA